MSKTAKWILIVLGLLVVVAVAAKMLGGSGKGEVQVTAETAQRTTIVETVDASGKVYPEVEVKISSDVSGEITELTVLEGDSVRRGQVLARIYADIYASQRDEAQARVTQSQASVANSQAALEALRAQLDQAKAAYDRNKTLYDDKVISKAEFEQFETSLRSAQSQYNAAQQNIRSLQAGTQSVRTSLEAANKNLGRTVITSPMDGVISSLTVKKGERVAGNSFSVGPEMMRVADLSNIEVRVEVGENDIIKIKLGDSSDVEIEAYNSRKFRGIVTQIASSTMRAEGASSLTAGDATNYEVHIRLDPSSYSDLINPSAPKVFPFRPGMNASAKIKTKRKDGVIGVPIGAVAARIKGSDAVVDQKTAADEGKAAPVAPAGDETEIVVFIVNKEGLVEKRVVTTGIQDIYRFEITSGLQGGETVVTAPYEAVNKTLKTGTKVKVVPKEKLF